ncbi:MAG: DNA polymerase I [Betaproteobacteria bacterium]|nr:DNA polymerase I [Betaproteobacteria bacterium]
MARMTDRSQKLLLLVDGSSYLYRAFHALPDLRNRHGEPTGAIFGVLNMLRRLLADYKPDYAACVFDARGPTFRDTWYPEYKAHRTPMPPDLSSQIEPLHQAVQALGWPLLVIEGVEADDVIGTLARQATQAGLRTVISSGDKDLVQLLDGQISLVNTLSNEKLDAAGATAKYGLPPEHFVDYLTLIGDAVDNVPGVAKVGPKTALKWLQQYGTLDTLMAHASEVTGAVGNNLRAVLDWLPQARRLLTIRCDVPLPLGPQQLNLATPDQDTLRVLAERYDLRSWIPREATPAAAAEAETETESGPASPPVIPAPVYSTVLTDEQLESWIDRITQAELTALDTETTSLDPMQAELVGLSLCVTPGEAAYIPLGHRGPDSSGQLDREQTLERLRPWLENPGARKVGQHFKFDQHVLANHGIILRGIAHDTLLQSYVLEAHQPHHLESLARRHLGRETLSYQDVTGKGAAAIGFEQVPLDRATAYAAEDADITLQVHQVLYPQIVCEPALDSVYRDIELPLQQVLWRMERNGVLLDTAQLERQSHELGSQLLSLEARTHAAAGHPFNLNSPKQIQSVLFEEQHLPVRKKTPSGAPSTDEDVLQQLALDYPIPKLILEYRSLAKLKSTYTDALPRRVNPRTGRVHTHYAQAVAVTGRLASSEPNLQNIPIRTTEGRRIRAAFIAPPGRVLVSADYSQIELRIMAHLSQDPGLLSAFGAGQDVHRATASEIFGTPPDEVSPEQRRAAKAINFGLIYGMSAFGLAAQLGIERSAAQAYMERYFHRYPGVARYMEQTRAQAQARGYVETLFGRRLWLPELHHGSSGRRQGAERAAINAPLQGTAADLIKRAMIVVARWLEEQQLTTLMILQVHDELILETPEAEREKVMQALPGLMSGVAELSVPLLVDVGFGPHWDAAH